MRAKEFLNEKRLDPELLRLYKQAKAKYPMYDEETALLKFLQRSAKHSEESDAREDSSIGKLEKKVTDIDKRVTKLEKGSKK